MKLRRSTHGFTLLEILIVIAIIGILSVLGVTSYLASQRQARDGRRVADLKQIQGVMENYFTEMNTYPANNCPTTVASYFPQGFPKDPVTKATYTFNTCSATNYCLCIQLENTTTGGNSTVLNCSNYSEGDKFCVQNLQ